MRRADVRGDFARAAIDFFDTPMLHCDGILTPPIDKYRPDTAFGTLRTPVTYYSQEDVHESVRP
jgi:hypothetical protein